MLINCVAYHNGQKLGDITVDAIPEHLAQPDCLVWVALQDPTPDEISHFGRQFALHPLAVEDALHGHQRPKLDEYGDTLFLVMKTLEPDSELCRKRETSAVLTPRARARSWSMLR